MLATTFRLRYYHVLIGIAAISVVVWLMIMIFSVWSNSAFAKETDEITEEEICAYINDSGWETDNEGIEKQLIMIPASFNDVYNDYNALQQKQGFDLRNYSGKQVTKYTVPVTNYPNVPENVSAHVLVYENKIIAADICSSALDGFIQPMR